MEIVSRQRGDDVPAGPATGLKGPTFGLARERLNRIELTLAIRGGSTITVFVEHGDEVSAETLDAFAADLAAGISAGESRSYADAWNATGQRAWVNLAEVVAFSVRQAK